MEPEPCGLACEVEGCPCDCHMLDSEDRFAWRKPIPHPDLVVLGLLKRVLGARRAKR